jgi:hypothetical protein
VNIWRAVETSNYVQIRNDVAADQRMSYRALGVLTFLLAQPPDRPIDSTSLYSVGDREGRDAVRTAMTELEAAGYVQRTKMQDPQTGQWSTRTTVYSQPQPDPANNGFSGNGHAPERSYPQVSPTTGFQAPADSQESDPTPGFPTPGNPSSGFSVGGRNTNHHQDEPPQIATQSALTVIDGGKAKPKRSRKKKGFDDPAVEQADALVRAWWESLTPKPVTSFMQVRTHAAAAIRAGHAPDAVIAAVQAVHVGFGPITPSTLQRALSGSVSAGRYAPPSSARCNANDEAYNATSF